jgi:hypothetical protein
MSRIGSGLLVLFFAAAAVADDKPKPRVSPAERLAALQKEYKGSEAAYYKAAGALPDTPEGNKKAQELYQAYDKKRADLFMEAVELAKADPKSDVGFAALEWVLTIPRSFYLPAGKPGLELLTEHHAANPKVGKVVAWVGSMNPRGVPSEAAANALIEAVAKKSPDKAARAQAVLAKAWQAKAKFASAEFRKEPDADRLAAEADKAFEAVLKDYADSPRLIREDAGTVGDIARSELFELRHLRVGKAAPEIAGEDLDGAKFKLSDYRGKVIVLDFWGDW